MKRWILAAAITLGALFGATPVDAAVATAPAHHCGPRPGQTAACGHWCPIVAAGIVVGYVFYWPGTGAPCA